MRFCYGSYKCIVLWIMPTTLVLCMLHSVTCWRIKCDWFHWTCSEDWQGLRDSYWASLKNDVLVPSVVHSSPKTECGYLPEYISPWEIHCWKTITTTTRWKVLWESTTPRKSYCGLPPQWGCGVNGTAVAAVLLDQSRSFMNLHIRYVH